MKTPWIVVYDGSNGKAPMGHECLRCRATVTMSLPISVSVWLAASKAFIREHRRCQEPAR